MIDKPGVNVSASSSASVSTTSGAKASATTVGAPVEYKVVDQPWQPDDPRLTEAMLTEIGQQGWRLTTVYPDTIRERTRWIFIR